MKETNTPQGNEESHLPFEKAFTRLEEILEKMNSGETSLDESLKLFEEADSLINICNKRLTNAERRVEMLIKNRGGELMMEGPGKPITADFLPPPDNGIRR